MALVVISVLLIFSFKANRPGQPTKLITKPSEVREGVALKKFSTAQEVSLYLKESSSEQSIGSAFGTNLKGLGTAPRDIPSEIGLGAPGLEADANSASRFSQTNIQVSGVDEPDIVKTNGKQLFFSPNQNYFYSFDFPVREYANQEIKIINAFPVNSLANVSKIDLTGNLLLVDNTLVVLDYNKITGFDITDPTQPKQMWRHTLKQNTTLKTARLIDNTIYIVAQTYLDSSSPCPRPLFGEGGGELMIKCSDIYYPNIRTNSDSLYSILTLEAASGKTLDSATFVGSANNSVVYMSSNNVYITYQLTPDFVEYFYGFVESSSQDLFDPPTLTKIRTLVNLDIGQDAKLVELENILSSYQFGLSDDDRLMSQTELTNRLNNYTESHKRELTSTIVVKVNVADLAKSTLGVVPGLPLNQFSLDEFKGNLRVATTVSTSFWSTSESVNDVYVLDQNMQVAGSVQDLGIGERLYAVRFVGPVGFAVTFKQIDPFYTLDMSDPTNPKRVGELKIPGFSSYLHPISEDLVLGVGSEANQVKLSLFDVSDINAPKEIAKYGLTEFWSEVADNHHAFLLDPQHKIVFIPAGNNAYIFSYSDRALTLLKAIPGLNSSRAVYINDYLYVLSPSTIAVYSETDWSLVGSLDL